MEEAAAISADLLAEARGVVPRDKSYTARYAACAVRGVCGDFFIRQGVTFEDMLARPHACDDASLDCVLCENCSLRNSMVDWRSHRVFARQKGRNHHGNAGENNKNRKTARVFGQRRYYMRVRYGI